MMLQSVRDNLKGTAAVFVLAIFIIPLILFGVEQLFVGSVGGTDVAEVNGEGVSRLDFQRELALEKQRRQQQFDLPPNSPQLDDSVLSSPVLQRMVQREALYQSAVKGGMGASRDELWKQIASIDAFQVDGKFNYDLFKERISYLYTPATFLNASEKDFILGHMNAGVANSGFIVKEELALLAAITQQKRSFVSIEIPAKSEPSVAITDGEIQEYYQANSAEFLEPETVTVEYVEISLEQLTAQAQVSEADIRAIYEEEVKSFKSDPQFSVAHILLEEKGSSDLLKEVSDQIRSGSDFGELAKKYSTDLGSKASGGNLGVMLSDVFPKAFVEAVKSLEVGAVSEAVKTEAGIHFIKLLEKTNVAPPSFDERKNLIAQQLAREFAQEEYLKKTALLDEKSFGADSLKYAADALGVEVKVSKPFTRNGGQDIASNQLVLNEAFGDEVLFQRQNSRVIEINGDKAIVLRLKDHQAEKQKPFNEVKDQIAATIKAQRIADEAIKQAELISNEIRAGKAAADVASANALELKEYENATRTSFEIGAVVLHKVFGLPRPAESSLVVDHQVLPDGGAIVVVLKGVTDGSIEDLAEEQLSGLKNQLKFQVAQAELTSFENGIIEKAKIDISR